MTLLVTGAAGFIGSNFVRYLIKQTSQNIISYDALTYAGNLSNIQDLPKDRHQFIHGDICNGDAVSQALKNHNVSTIVHFAAESHVDRSIQSADPFIQTNIVGTQRLLDAAKAHGVSKFIHVSTDEVYGTLQVSDPPFTEAHHIMPNSPYAASKAASDLLVRSYVETYDFPAIITRCSNNYGPYQFPEKLIPLMIHNACNNIPLPIYGTGENIRDWVHVEDHCEAIHAVLTQGNIGDVYNIGGECELTNIDIVKKIITICGADDSLMTFVKDRPGHDFRYAMDISKIKNELGVSPKMSFEKGLQDTIDWYMSNTKWLKSIINGDYQQYYKEQYK